MGVQATRGDIADDQAIWALSSNGLFTIKSAYTSLVASAHGPALDWKWLWHWIGSQCAHVFAWMILNDGLNTNGKRVRCGLASVATCPPYNSHDETETHLLRECHVAREVWHTLLPSAQ